MTPAPGVSEPHVRNDVERCRLWTTIVGGDAEQQLFGVIGVFGSLDEDVEVAIVLEGICISDVVLAVFLPSSSILLDQVFVGETALRELVEILHVGCRRLAEDSDGEGRQA